MKFYHFAALNMRSGNGEDKPNYLLDCVKTLFTDDEVKSLQADNIEDPQKLYGAIRSRIETSTATRIRKEIENDVKGSASKGAFVRAEKTLSDMIVKLGVDRAKLNEALEGTDDKGRYAKIAEFGTSALETLLTDAKKASTGENKERLNQLIENNKVFETKVKELETALQTKDTEHSAALAAKDNEFSVTGHRVEVFNSLFSKDAEKKFRYPRTVVNTLLNAKLDKDGLRVVMENGESRIFKDDKAVQIEGTAHTHTLKTFIDSLAANEKWYQESNANPDNNKPGNGVVIKPDDKRVANFAPGVAATIQGQKANTDHF